MYYFPTNCHCPISIIIIIIFNADPTSGDLQIVNFSDWWRKTVFKWGSQNQRIYL